MVPKIIRNRSSGTGSVLGVQARAVEPKDDYILEKVWLRLLYF